MSGSPAPAQSVTRRVALDHPRLAGRTGRGIRIAVIDSGVAPGHPHVGPLEAGVSLIGDDAHDTADQLGHGTAVAAAIHEKAPDATIIPVRVLGRELATSARILARAIGWAVAARVHLINLSLGTTNDAHIALFEAALDEAQRQGVLVVSAARQEITRWYPGSLEGALGIVAGSDVPRDALEFDGDSAISALSSDVRSSPYPRPIEGLPPQRNLMGVSFAVANATGILACALEAGAPPEAAAMRRWLAQEATVHARALPSGDVR